MIDVAILNVIRRWALRIKCPSARFQGVQALARNTIKKHLRSEESEPKYPRRVSSTKLDPYADKLSNWLETEATKSRKQRRTLRQIHTDPHETLSTIVPSRLEKNRRLRNSLNLLHSTIYTSQNGGPRVRQFTLPFDRSTLLRLSEMGARSSLSPLVDDFSAHRHCASDSTHTPWTSLRGPSFRQ